METETLLNYVNNIHPKLKFTLELVKDNIIIVLDLRIVRM